MDLKQQILHYYRVDEMSLREIARRTGADRKTVTRLIDAYEAASTTNGLEGIFPYSDIWIKNPIECSGSGSYRYITISILTCDGLTKGVWDLKTEGCTHMTEIEFYTK